MTVVGVGGVGKTRLALEVARHASDAYADGVSLVELAAVSSADGLVDAVMAAVGAIPALGPPGRTRRSSRSRRRRRCWSYWTTASTSSGRWPISSKRLLASGAAGSAFLATSREPLGVCGRAGQCIWRHCARRGETTWEDVAGVPSSRAVLPPRHGGRCADRPPSTTTLPRWRAICRRLDGIPLALELAAARARSMPLAELERRLDDTFRLLVGTGRGAVERHQTLRRTVEWSYSLLTDHRAGRLRAGLGFPRWLQPRVGRGRGGDHRTLTGPLTDPRLPTRSEPWSTSRWCSWTATAAATASSKRSTCSRPNIWRWRARPTGPARPTHAGVCSSSRTAPARPSAMISIGYSRRPQRAATWDRRQCGRRQHGDVDLAAELLSGHVLGPIPYLRPATTAR